MHRNSIGVILIGCLFLGNMPGSVWAGAQTLEKLSGIYTLEYPPICFTENGVVTGAATDIVQEMMQRLHVNYKIRSLPWKRGYTLLSEGEDVALYTVTRTPDRENLFKWVGPIITSRLVFFARADSAVEIADLEDAKQVDRIGVVDGYSVAQFLAQRGFANIDPVKSESSNPAKLITKRISLWATVDLVGRYNIRLQGIAQEKIKIAYVINEQEKYLAFSRQVSDQTVQQWQAVLESMQQDGTVADLVARWMK